MINFSNLFVVVRGNSEVYSFEGEFTTSMSSAAIYLSLRDATVVAQALSKNQDQPVRACGLLTVAKIKS